MTLRILAGEFKGRLLKSPRGDQTRPTTSMLRKAVFDILQQRICGTDFLDLFAGSGAMGLEALSRGASHVTFVENHKEALRSLRANVDSLKLGPQVTIYSLDVFEILKKLSQRNRSFDLIYADPPYHRPAIYTELLTFIDTSSLLAKEGLLLLESPLQFKSPILSRLVSIDERRFGDSLLHQYTHCFIPQQRVRTQ